MRAGSWMWGLMLPLLFGLLLALNYAEAQQGGVGDSNPCTSKLNCSECIRTPMCAWCAQPVSDLFICVRNSAAVTLTLIFSRTLKPMKVLGFPDVTSRADTSMDS